MENWVRGVEPARLLAVAQSFQLLQHLWACVARCVLSKSIAISRLVPKCSRIPATYKGEPEACEVDRHCARARKTALKEQKGRGAGYDITRKRIRHVASTKVLGVLFGVACEASTKVLHKGIGCTVWSSM